MKMYRVVILAFSLLLAMSAVAPAQDDIGFKSPSAYSTDGKTFTDEAIQDLIATLDELLARPTTLEDFEKEARLHFWRFITRLQQGVLTPDHHKTILAYLDKVKKKHSGSKELINKQRKMLQTQMIGVVAPNITGIDLDGVEFELTDYRGKVIVLVFSGDWCGPCRGEYPYQRAIIEELKGKPFAILGINSDTTVEIAKTAKKENNLDYRTWFDGGSTKGPIATDWNVTGWPSIYVLDHKGVIRFARVRGEEVNNAARLLVKELIAGGSGIKK